MTQQDNNNDLNLQNDYLDTDNDKTQDAGNADAAKFNADEQEQAVNERLSSETDNSDDLAGANTSEETDINNDLGEELGGATNLSLDQLKQERDPEGNNTSTL